MLEASSSTELEVKINEFLAGLHRGTSVQDIKLMTNEATAGPIFIAMIILNAS